ncbi:hypothetical protein AVEN_2277-1 [Araneus ventricosus]|uniref:Uncharacterized protein n=1 Tax=Araneus ventricosus TaxID=182803 RepID=A0A4Y2FPR3_ARAVE|nr:hypothetical protein AVEN_2277-1 [Araneus ventricosus]
MDFKLCRSEKSHKGPLQEQQFKTERSDLEMTIGTVELQTIEQLQTITAKKAKNQALEKARFATVLSNRTKLDTTSVRRLCACIEESSLLLAVFFYFRCHTKAIERCGKADTELCGSSALDDYVRARIVNRTSMQAFETKEDFNPGAIDK